VGQCSHVERTPARKAKTKTRATATSTASRSIDRPDGIRVADATLSAFSPLQGLRCVVRWWSLFVLRGAVQSLRSCLCQIIALSIGFWALYRARMSVSAGAVSGGLSRFIIFDFLPYANRPHSEFHSTPSTSST